MKEWIHELHEKRFGLVIGEAPMRAPDAQPEWEQSRVLPRDKDDIPF